MDCSGKIEPKASGRGHFTPKLQKMLKKPNQKTASGWYLTRTPGCRKHLDLVPIHMG
jgi:hypothetical protein